MKILVVSPQPFFEERGTPIAVRALVETLQLQGHDVDLLAYHCGEDVELQGAHLIRAPKPPGVSHVPIGISWQKLVCDVCVIRRMLQLIQHEHYDVIHAVEEAVFPAVLLGRLAGARVIYDMDSLLSEQLVAKWTALRFLRRPLSYIEAAALKRCDAVLPVCDDLADEVRRLVPDANVRVLSDIPLESSFSEQPICLQALSDGNLIALYVGNLEPYQGVDSIVEALAHIPQHVPVSFFVIGGRQADIERCRMKVRAEDETRIHFLGSRPLQELNSFLQQADILLSPRKRGGNTPMKIYSYMQAGKPIIATAIRSHLQVLDDSCAVMVEPTPEAIAEAVCTLAGDPALRERIGRAAARRVIMRHSPERFRATLAETYSSLY